MDSGFKTLKLRANERNNSQHCWPNNVERFHTFAQQVSTTRNNMQQGVQTDATYNM